MSNAALSPATAIRGLCVDIERIKTEWRNADQRVLKWVDLGMETGGFEKLARDERAPLGNAVDSYYLSLQEVLLHVSETLGRELIRLGELFSRATEPRDFWPTSANSKVERILLLLQAEAQKQQALPDDDKLEQVRGKTEPKALIGQPTDADPHAPYMPADWFRVKFGIPSERLRSARRRGRLAAVDISEDGKRPRYHYSIPDAIRLWPDDGIYLPEDPASTG